MPSTSCTENEVTRPSLTVTSIAESKSQPEPGMSPPFAFHHLIVLFAEFLATFTSPEPLHTTRILACWSAQLVYQNANLHAQSQMARRFNRFRYGGGRDAF